MQSEMEEEERPEERAPKGCTHTHTYNESCYCCCCLVLLLLLLLLVLVTTTAAAAAAAAAATAAAAAVAAAAAGTLTQADSMNDTLHFWGRFSFLLLLQPGKAGTSRCVHLFSLPLLSHSFSAKRENVEDFVRSLFLLPSLPPSSTYV